MNILWHVVLIQFYESTPEEVREDFHKRYKTIAEDCGGKDKGILFFTADWNLDMRKNQHLVEIAGFKDQESLQAFRMHPVHVALANDMSKVADWRVGDIMAPRNLF